VGSATPSPQLFLNGTLGIWLARWLSAIGYRTVAFCGVTSNAGQALVLSTRCAALLPLPVPPHTWLCGVMGPHGAGASRIACAVGWVDSFKGMMVSKRVRAVSSA
jgi:hypothetical protein